jgi:amino acid transporter/nucleotide-binding universal stress UspA family protein
MAKRKLKRQLGLVQVIMLGTAGTIAAEIFVLTGHVAGIAGPDTVLALIIGGVLTLSIALNYCELATTYPVTGGAMAYVREAYGNNLIMFLVGSLDGLSSTFYAALSAVGFAYSLKIFLPFIPVIPVAIAVIALVSFTQIRGVKQAGNVQIILGGFLMLVFALYVGLGLTRPEGFQREVYLSGRILFDNQGLWANVSRMLMAVALVYNAYVGFEVIADDAEEITNPSRNIPLGILLSLFVATVIYSLVALVTIGTVPYDQLAGSETALTDAARRFWPVLGVPLMGAAGLVATLTSINSAMLSATREAFTLSRERVWPRVLSRLSRWRTPYAATIFIGALSALIAVIGLVDFLSFISSAGYMFVLFWASLAMIRLREKHPTVIRPFKVPLFPFSAYLAAGSGVLIIAFAQLRALIFLAVVLLLLTAIYFGSQASKKRRIRVEERLQKLQGAGIVLVPAVNPDIAANLVTLACLLVEKQEDARICLLSVQKLSPLLSAEAAERLLRQRKFGGNLLLERVAGIAFKHNVAIYTKRKAASSVAEGILSEAPLRSQVNLILMGWPASTEITKLADNVVKEVLVMARKDVAVYRKRGHEPIRSILVPIGSGPHARLALKMACQMAENIDGEITALRILNGHFVAEETEDVLGQMQEIIDEELGHVPHRLAIEILRSESVVEGIVQATKQNHYDLVIIGASGEVFSHKYLFGRINDELIDTVDCSLLIVRRYQPEALAWLRQQVKSIEE